MIHQTLMRVACAGSMLAAAGAYAAATTIPSDWNQTTWTEGSYFENFNSSTKPAWAGNDASLVSGDATTQPTTRFWTSDNGYSLGNQLSFATDGITNEFSNATSSLLDPLYVDMMCKFTPMDSDPAAETGAYMLRTYVSSSSNLVVQTTKEAQTNSTTIQPSTYYRLTIKIAGTNYIVKLNDAEAANVYGSQNSFTKLIFAGSGYLDDLYISHGDPARSKGYVDVVTNFTGAGTTGASDSEMHAINNWIAENATALSGTTGVTIEKAAKYFATGVDPVAEGGEMKDPTIDLGISDFWYNSADSITVKVYLKVNGAVKASGKLNGRIQLYGAAGYAAAKAGTWKAISTAKTPMMTDFTNGYTAVYTFAGVTGYQFFKPVIVTE